jgi:transposase-like protein
MPDFYRRVKHASSMDSMSHDARIEAAIAELDSQERVNYAATAKEWDLDPTTLWRRHIGKTRSIQEANTESHQKLINIQEEALIEHANKLTNQGIPPTPQILKNIVEEISKAKLGPN